jgi:hypothetical protein
VFVWYKYREGSLFFYYRQFWHKYDTQSHPLSIYTSCIHSSMFWIPWKQISVFKENTNWFIWRKHFS